MTIKIPFRNLIIRSASSSSDDNSVSSSSSTLLKLRRRCNKSSTEFNKKSVSFDFDNICAYDTPSYETQQQQQEYVPTALWYTREERQQFKKETAHQIRLCKAGQLPETEEQTSLGLDTNRTLTRCRREYCYDAVLGEQFRLTKSRNCGRNDSADCIAKAYLKGQMSCAKQ